MRLVSLYQDHHRLRNLKKAIRETRQQKSTRKYWYTFRDARVLICTGFEWFSTKASLFGHVRAPSKMFGNDSTWASNSALW